MEREFLKWKTIDHNEFRSPLLKSELCDTCERPSTAEGYFECYERVIRRLADEFAPVKRLSRRRQRLAQWMDSDMEPYIATIQASMTLNVFS